MNWGSLLTFAINNGVAGLATAAAVALCYVVVWQSKEIRRLSGKVEKVQDDRVLDQKAFIDIGTKMNDKSHRTANDLARVTSFIERQQREQRKRLGGGS